MKKFFKIKEKTYFEIIFAQREFSLKTLCTTAGVPHHLNDKDRE